eukprot:7992937-Pyramimonas_sp.AAC.1
MVERLPSWEQMRCVARLGSEKRDDPLRSPLRRRAHHSSEVSVREGARAVELIGHLVVLAAILRQSLLRVC